MSKEVTISFNGISSPVLKAIATFKLQKRNTKGLSKEEKQQILQELDDLFIIMVSDIKLNKKKPIWDYINIREEFILEEHGVDPNSEEEDELIYKERYELYKKMRNEGVEFETCLYSLYGMYSTAYYSEHFNIEYVDNVLKDIIKAGYLHPNSLKLSEKLRRILVWMTSANIQQRTAPLSEFLLYAIVILFTHISLKGYGKAHVVKAKNWMGDDVDYTVTDFNFLNEQYERITSEYNTNNRFTITIEELSSTEIFILMKAIMKSKKGVNIYSSIFAALFNFINNGTYEKVGGNTINMKFENDKFYEEIKKLFLDAIKNIDVKKANKVKFYSNEEELFYLENVLKLTNDENLRKKVFELKLK